MNTVFIVPTGIGAKIGGHAGDATPAFKLIASVSDIAITHPNVVNASDINEMPENTWYVEGSILDRFLEGKICLEKPTKNKILLVVNKPIRPETINAVNAARYTIGCEIQIVELMYKLTMQAELKLDGATGTVRGWRNLLEQVSEYDFDALAIASSVDVPQETALNYFRHGGLNPWGGVEAVASKLIANKINKPVTHAPVESDDPTIKAFNEVVDSRMAAEIISQCFLHCVFKGLHKAPRISKTGLSVEDIDCIITPIGCYGRPHRACENAGIPIIAVRENTTCLKTWSFPIIVENYIEAAGYIQLLRIGIVPKSVRSLVP